MSRPAGPPGSCRHMSGDLDTGRRARQTSPTDRRRASALSRKEVFQPHLPVRLPCYDLAPITGFHGLTGGVYKARERIHRAMADARLLANPASRSRVAGSDPNWEGIS